MWPVLIFLLVLICWIQYIRKQKRDRRNHRAGLTYDQSVPAQKPPSVDLPPTGVAKKMTPPETIIPNPLALFETPPNPGEVEIADDPNAEPAILAQLCQMNQRRSIRRRIARNPNTPIEALLSLIQEFPQDIARHPRFIQVSQTNPNQINDLISKIDPTFQCETLLQALIDYDELEDSHPMIWELVKERSIAQNPMTLPEILKKIGLTHKHEKIRKLVACNPNTPESVLLTLAEQFPQEVAENPMFMLMHLENPEFIQEMPDEHLAKIIRHDDTPLVFINAAIHYHSPFVLEALLKKPQLSSEQLTSVIDRAQRNHIHLFLKHKNCTESVKMMIVKGNNQTLQIGLARDCLRSRTPTAESIAMLEALIEHGALAVQKFIACDTYTSDAILDRLLSSDRKELQYSLAWHCTSSQGLSDRLQGRLAQNQLIDLEYRISVRQILAENKVNPDILERLSRDPYAKVRSTIAKRSDLSANMLLELAQDPAEAVQHRLVKNQSIDADQLTTIAQTSHPRMRQLAAQHPNTPVPVLEMLVDDPLLAEHIARNPHTPTATLQKIAGAGTQDIALTQNPVIADAIVHPILAKLAIDPNYTRRKLVARHPQTPRDILEQLAQDPEPKVQRLAQKRLTNS